MHFDQYKVFNSIGFKIFKQKKTQIGEMCTLRKCLLDNKMLSGIMGNFWAVSLCHQL